MIRAVLDPGVLIAALLSSQGAPARLLTLWLEGAYELITSPKLLGELERVLLRPKFRRYVTEDEAMSYVAMLQRLTIVVTDPGDVPQISRDPNDDYLIALGRAADAAAIVSGDPHLTELDLDPPVLTPREFLATVS